MKTIVLLFAILAIATCSVNQCSCPQGQYWNINSKVCESIPKEDQVENCQTYRQFDSGNIYCEDCAPTYTLYPNANKCHSTFPNCQIYRPQQDVCAQCRPGFYVDSNGICQQNPQKNDTGYVQGCESYKSWPEFSCAVCSDSTYFVAHNECVKSSSVIEHCIYAIDRQGSYSCKQCEQGFYPMELNNKVFCSPNPQEGQSGYVKGCANYFFAKYQFKTFCSICEPQHWLSGQECKKVSHEDPNCSQFVQNDQCGQCKEGTYYIGHCEVCPSLQQTVRQFLK